MLVSIRPEALSVGSSEMPVNRVDGRVIERMYLGSNVQYKVKGEGDLLWNVSEANPQSMRQSGDRVLLTISPADVVILKV